MLYISQPMAIMLGIDEHHIEKLENSYKVQRVLSESIILENFMGCTVFTQYSSHLHMTPLFMATVPFDVKEENPHPI